MKGVIFDFDGVIVDTETRRFKNLAQVLKKQGYALHPSDFNAFVGRKRAVFLQERFPDMPRRVRGEIIAAARKGDGGARLIPGIKRLLVFLKSRGKVIALATGSRREFVTAVLRKHGLYGFFDQLVTGEEFSSSKPDPECFKLALERMGLRPSEVVIVEDSMAGVLAGKRLRSRVYGILTYGETLHRADKVFCDHRDLLAHLRTVEGW